MWDFLGNLSKGLQATIVILAISMSLIAVAMAAFLIFADPDRGISLPFGFVITARQDPSLAKCQAASKALSDIAASYAKTASDLIAAESSEAERVSGLRRKYLDDHIVEPSSMQYYAQGGPRVSAFLPDTVKEYQNIVAARETAQKQQADLSAKVDEVNRLCGVIGAAKRD